MLNNGFKKSLRTVSFCGDRKSFKLLHLGIKKPQRSHIKLSTIITIKIKYLRFSSCFGIIAIINWVALDMRIILLIKN